MAAKPATKTSVQRLLSPVESFIKTESSSGIVLIIVALIAFIWANSPWSGSYYTMKAAPTGVRSPR
jgi:NhaA family Na+:H+ antiporter